MLQIAALALAALSFTAARAEPQRFVLRMATVAPDGTGYARELKAWARDIADDTNGEVQIKWYWGGIAGDDREMTARIRRGQLDGLASGMACQTIGRSFRALHVPGLYRTREEVHYVAGRLWPELGSEFRREGFELLGFAMLGAVDVFSREPIRTLADLARERTWVWEADDMLRWTLGEMGFQLVPTGIDAAGRAYSDGRIDGFLTIPSGTLAFQWYTQAHYLTELRINFLTGCVVIANRAFDRLPVAHQQAMRSATAKFCERLERVNAEQDQRLLGGLFSKQGVKPVAVDEKFRAEFAHAARAATEKLGDKLLDPALLRRVESLVDEYRAQHGGTR